MKGFVWRIENLDERGEGLKKNYYNSLCTEMYEILHGEAPQDELEFYLSYARKGMSILEPMCGSGRFLVPFLERGLDIRGVDLSGEMLDRLKKKAPAARVVQGDLLTYDPEERFDYIFIPSGSVSLLTDMELCRAVLRKMKHLLKAGGKFVFAVDTVADRCPDDDGYRASVSVKTKEGMDLLLKEKKRYDVETRTQFSPGIYELYDGTKLLRREEMDFQTHLYELGEIEPYLLEIGFAEVKVYASFEKEIAEDNRAEMFLYECSLMESQI